MKKLKINYKLLFFISLGLNFAYIINIIVFDYKFTSTDDFNNIITPIAAIIALIFAYNSWRTSNESNNIAKSEMVYQLLINDLYKILEDVKKMHFVNQLTFSKSNFPFSVDFEQYLNVISETVSKLHTTAYFEKLINIDDYNYDDFSTEFSLLPNNINEYYNNKKLLTSLNKVLSKINESDFLIFEHRIHFLQTTKESINLQFRDFIFTEGKYEKIYAYSSQNVLKKKPLRLFDVPLKVQEINTLIELKLKNTP